MDGVKFRYGCAANLVEPGRAMKGETRKEEDYWLGSLKKASRV